MDPTIECRIQSFPEIDSGEKEPFFEYDNYRFASKFDSYVFAFYEPNSRWASYYEPISKKFYRYVRKTKKWHETQSIEKSIKLTTTQLKCESCIHRFNYKLLGACNKTYEANY